MKRSVVALGLTITLAACDKIAPREKSVTEQQDEAFAKAYVAITAKHPASMKELRGSIRSDPATCVVADLACFCVWRFLTPAKTKEIQAVAWVPYPALDYHLVLFDRKTGEGRNFDDNPAEAELQFLRSTVGAKKATDYYVADTDNQLWLVKGENLYDALTKSKGRLTSPDEARRFKFNLKYKSLAGTAAITTCLDEQNPLVSVKLDTDDEIVMSSAKP